MAAVHRVGPLRIGDVAVVVATTAAHRGDAFAASRDLIDTLKAEVPIWKHQVFADGDRGVGRHALSVRAAAGPVGRLGSQRGDPAGGSSPPVVVTALAMLWVSWLGRDGRGEVDRDVAVERLGKALRQEPPAGTRRSSRRRPRDREHRHRRAPAAARRRAGERRHRARPDRSWPLV